MIRASWSRTGMGSKGGSVRRDGDRRRLDQVAVRVLDVGVCIVVHLEGDGVRAGRGAATACELRAGGDAARDLDVVLLAPEAGERIARRSVVVDDQVQMSAVRGAPAVSRRH